MNLLLVGEDGAGSLLASLLPGLRAAADVTILNPAASRSALSNLPGVGGAAGRRLVGRRDGLVFVEAVRQLSPDAVLVIKGRGLTHDDVKLAAATGARIAIYYPDNPYWRWTDPPDPVPRLAAADLAILWNERVGELLAGIVRRVAVLPFGYDHRWFPVASPTEGDRRGIVFIGTWSPRRERYLSALHGLPLTVCGTRWPANGPVRAEAPRYGTDAGALLRSAAIGVNLLHPQCAGAHNMRTREVAASGAMQLTDAGRDGTPLRPGVSCEWFRSPMELRHLAETYLHEAETRISLAASAQRQVIDDTYERRAAQIAEMMAALPGVGAPR